MADIMRAEKSSKKTDNNFFGFLDFEMTCDGRQENGKFIDDKSMKRSHREIISAGLVICDEKYNIKRKYSTFIKPVHNTVLTDYCRNLTGITQYNVDHGKKCNNAFRDISEICEEYSVRYIFTFGNADEVAVRYSARWNKKAKEKIYNLHKVSGRIIDIRPSVIKAMSERKTESKRDGLSKIALNLDIETKGNCHNSLNDALLLFEVCKKLDIDLNTKSRAKIRPVKEADYIQVCKLLSSCSEDSEEYIKRFLTENPDTCFVAEEYKKIIGVIIAGKDEGKGYIYHIALRNDYRNKEVAPEMVNNVIKAMKKSGIKPDSVDFTEVNNIKYI